MSVTENVLKAVLTAEDRGMTSALKSAAGVTETLSSKMKKYIGVGAAVAVGQKAVGAAFSAVTSNIGNAVSRYDQLNRFPQTLNNLGISTKAAKKATDELSKGIDGLPTTLDSATAGVSRLVSSNGDINKSTKYFLAMNNAIIAGGQSTEIQASAVEQLSQSYAKGKMDMMEWRSLQTAMPGQLRQVAKAMGTTTTELGEGLRSGDIAMDDFMDTLVQLNDKGVDGFASFADQAQSATGGIATSMSLIQSAITRGIANCIGSIDTMLSSNGLPKINEIALKVRDGVNVAFARIQAVIEGLDVGKLKILGASILGVVGAVRSLMTVFKVSSAINSARVAVLNFSEANKTASVASGVLSGKLTATQAVMGTFGNKATAAATKMRTFAAANKVALASTMGVVAVVALLAVGIYKLSTSGKSVDQISKKITKFGDNASKKITAFANKLPTMIDELIPSLTKAGTQLFQSLVNSASKIITPLTSAITSVIQALCAALPTLMPALLNAAITMFNAIVNAIPIILPKLIEGALMMVQQLANALPTLVPIIINGGVTLLLGIVRAIPRVLPRIIAAMPKIVNSMAKALVAVAGAILSAGITLLRSLSKGISRGASHAISSAKSAAKRVLQAVKSGLGSLVSAGKDFIEGLWRGISAKFSSVVSRLKEKVASLPKAVKKVLGIASPSRVMKEVGYFFTEGLALGIANNAAMKHVERAVNSVISIPELAPIDGLNMSLAGGFDGSLNDAYNYTSADYTFIVETNIDGKKAAESIVPHAEPILERNQTRKNRSRGVK